MSAYYVVAKPRDRRRSVDTPRYQQFVDDDQTTTSSRRPSRYNDDYRYDNDRMGRSGALVLSEPSRRSYEKPRRGRVELGKDEALVIRPARRRSPSRPRFRDDDSLVDDDDPPTVPNDGNTYIRSRSRPGQRPSHALVRNKSRRRRNSLGDERDLERKTSRRNKEFRSKRDNLENEEAVMLLGAKSQERDRYARIADDYDDDRERYYRVGNSDPLRARGRKPRTDIPSDDDRDVVVVPSSNRRRNARDDASTRYRPDPRASRPQGTTTRQPVTPAQAPNRAPNPDLGTYVRQGENYVRSGETFYREGRGLVEAMQNLGN